MRTHTYPIKGGEVIAREATKSDVAALAALNQACYNLQGEENVAWKSAHLSSHQRHFPRGQIVIESDGKIVAASANLIVDFGSDPTRSHTFAGITDGGFFYNHTATGDTLYGVDTYVHPDYRRKGISTLIQQLRKDLCKDLNLRRIAIGARLFDYQEKCDGISPDEYAARVEAEEETDAVLTFLFNQGFALKRILRNYLHDPRSGDAAALLEWLNPAYQQPKDIDNGKVRVACVQYKVRKVASFEDFAEQVRYFVETATDYDCDFVMFPEFFSVQLLSYLEALSPIEGIRRLSEFADEFIELLSGLAKRHGIHIIGGSHPIAEGEKLFNKSLVFSPDGSHIAQPKLHITPSERRYWGISGGDELYLLDTPKAKVGVLICYDIQFPEASRYLADQGADIIFVPYCTDNRQGHLRVTSCARARAIENQLYVVTAGIIGNLPSVPAMDIHYGQATVFTPSDFEYARDGIQAQADSNVETLLITDLDIKELRLARDSGSVTHRIDRRRDLFEYRHKLKNKSLDGGVEVSKPLDMPPG